MSAPTWNEEFELSKGSYSVSDVQDYIKYILEKLAKNINYNNNPSLEIYMYIYK